MKDNFAYLCNFIQPGFASFIVGGQFGSEAKGLAAAIVATHSKAIRYGQRLICTTNAGAQAGHTTVLDDGRKFVCYHLPTIGVLSPASTIYLNAGSIIDPELLWDEILQVSQVTGEDFHHLMKRVVIHPNAAVIQMRHKIIEATATQHLGSTQKGIGAALSDKIMRKPGSTISEVGLGNFGGTIGSIDLNRKMMDKWAVTVEVPQGTGLSMNAGHFYPKCTSRDCWVGQGMTDAGINPYFISEVLMVQRTFPIRVGHIFDATGQRVGDSGPFYPDSAELDWEKDFPDLEPERTTVTKRVRRIATFSALQYRDGLLLNRPTIVLNTFMNYFSAIALPAANARWPLTKEGYLNRLKQVETDAALSPLPTHLWSYGPKVSDTFFDWRD